MGLFFVILVAENIFSSAPYKEVKNYLWPKILIKSTNFDVNIFLLWHLEVSRYIYYRQLRGRGRYSKGTSCNLYFGIFFMIIYFNFFSDVFLFFVFSGTSFVYTKKENIFFSKLHYKEEKNILYREMKLILLIQVLPQTTIKRYLKLQS